MAPLQVIDSHTEGEPTRVVVDGWPAVRGATMAERRAYLAANHDHLRCGVVLEPRGHEAIVGALLTPPVEPGSRCGVVFFNDVGYLGMCGHGLIGLVRTLQHLGRFAGGTTQVDTPVGPVRATLESDGVVTIRNVPAYADTLDLAIDVPGYGRVTGDVAWGGNWFFITHLPAESLILANVRRLTEVTMAIRAALRASGSPVDHVELSGPPSRPGADARNFVLCPGAAYDRSPCGTGTSAVMAVRHARGQLGLGARWRQESITGSLFTGWLERDGAHLVPSIQGKAYITAVSTLFFDPGDPFRAGLVG
jgi:4-hydroxyproline epimerase